MDKARDIAAQIEQCVHLHRGLRGSKRRPRKQRERQVDRRRVQGVRRVGQVDPKGFVDIPLAGDGDQALREVGINPPIARSVRIGQRIARDLTTDAHVVELLGLRAQTRFDVPQALAKRQLRKGHAPKLILAREALDHVIATMARHASRQGLLRKMLHQLREYQFPRMHQIPRFVGSGPPWHRAKLKSRTSSYAAFC